MNERIKQLLLKNKELDLTEEELDKYLTSILQLGKWEEVRKGILNILYENDRELWDEAILLIYYFLNRKYYFEEIETIALIHDCLMQSDNLDENLVWTITKTIKLLPYDSEYEPFDDDLILKEIEKIKDIRFENN